MNEDNYLIDGNMSIDFDAHAAYLTINPCADQLFTVQHNDIVNIDYNAKGEIHGFELLNIDKGFPVEEMAERNSILWGMLKNANDRLAAARSSFTG